MATCTYPKGSKAPHQNVDTPQEIGRDRFVPKGNGGVGHPSGKTSYPPTKQHVTLSTDKTHANMHKAWAKGGGSAQKSFTAPKSRMKFATEKAGDTRDRFVPESTSKFGVGGV